MRFAGACYREYQPCEALRGWVRALFSFSEPGEARSPTRPVLLDVQFERTERFCAPTFADAHLCIVFTLEKHYCPDGLWRRSSLLAGADAIGPMTFPGPPSVPARAESIGAYFCAGAIIPGASATELENRAVPLDQVWGAEVRRLADELSSLPGETARLNRLESALLQKMRARRPKRAPIDISGITSSIVQTGGQVEIEQLAEAAGLSRRHFTRVFRDNVGVSPKIYCELARFRSALGYVPCGESVEWARVALDCGYADQSHMIAEFRRFAGLTPQALVDGRWFHPFMEAAYSNHRASGSGRI
jgi:AraC-like DNA-binding protein